ncbi:MAG: hypothetical protein IJA34_00375 [Lachnospiraceae bacterium]|nr:hypothetical protein [Lachnospiraceae bacterium]
MNTTFEDAVSYRIPLQVTEIMLFSNGDAFPICPKCKITLERTYQRYCDRCGQCLNWKGFFRANVIKWKPKD